jgi:hypothetical protein
MALNSVTIKPKRPTLLSDGRTIIKLLHDKQTGVFTPLFFPNAQLSFIEGQGYL